MNKRTSSAFTMLELIMVIVVLGILASLALPRMERDYRTEAADNILSAIRYAQHMALMDNVVLPGKAKWQRRFWRFGKEGCSDNGIFYYVASDKNMGGNIDLGEAAIDPANANWMMGINGKDCESDLSEQVFSDGRAASKNIFLTKLYGISEGKMTFSDSCKGTSSTKGHVAFDYLGRPHAGITSLDQAQYSSFLSADCNITLKYENAELSETVITIEKETGRAYIAK